MLYLSYPTVTNSTTATDPSIVPISAPDVRTCSRCGLTESLLRTEGLLGCATCYETFADLVAQAAEALQGVTVDAPASPDAGTDSPLTPVATTAQPRRRKALSWLPRRMQVHLTFPPESSSRLSKTKKRNTK